MVEEICKLNIRFFFLNRTFLKVEDNLIIYDVNLNINLNHYSVPSKSLKL